MKTRSSPRAGLSSAISMILVIIGFGMINVEAATLMNMTFGNGGLDINEATGWNGTTAPGGSLAANLTVSSGMMISGDFTAQNAVDSFHVDGWHTDNTADTGVGFVIATSPTYVLNLGSGTETFSTLVHNHPANGAEIFDSVTLKINSITIDSQTYIPDGGPQTLVWTIPANVSLNNLTSAEFKLFFSGTANPNQNNHGPEWNLVDGAFLSFTGDVVTANVTPEPSQSMLVLLGLAMAVVTRRRRN